MLARGCPNPHPCLCVRRRRLQNTRPSMGMGSARGKAVCKRAQDLALEVEEGTMLPQEWKHLQYQGLCAIHQRLQNMKMSMDMQRFRGRAASKRVLDLALEVEADTMLQQERRHLRHQDLCATRQHLQNTKPSTATHRFLGRAASKKAPVLALAVEADTTQPSAPTNPLIRPTAPRPSQNTNKSTTTAANYEKRPPQPRSPAMAAEAEATTPPPPRPAPSRPKATSPPRTARRPSPNTKPNTKAAAPEKPVSKKPPSRASAAAAATTLTPAPPPSPPKGPSPLRTARRLSPITKPSTTAPRPAKPAPPPPPPAPSPRRTAHKPPPSTTPST